VEHAQESTSVSRAESLTLFEDECDGAICEKEFLDSLLEFVVVVGVERVHACEDHVLGRFVAFEGLDLSSTHVGVEGVANVGFGHRLHVREEVPHLPSPQVARGTTLRGQHSHFKNVILPFLMKAVQTPNLSQINLSIH
jgi:hypothetical protein